MYLTLVLTHQCDLACGYCYAGPKDARTMPRSVGRRAIDRALLATPAGGELSLGLFGGEPLLAWDVARELVRYARERARRHQVTVRADLTTNGTHLTDAVLDEALALELRLAVSMDGLPEAHDRARPRRGGRPSSAAALAAIDRLVARGVPFRVISVVRPDTVDRLVSGARFLADRGVPALVHSLDHTAPWARADAAPLRRAIAGLRALYVERFPALEVAWIETKALLLANPGLQRPTCGAARGEVAVAPSGRLYPCERLVADDAPGPHCLGHLDDASGPLRGPSCSTRPPAESACGDCATEPVCTNDCACANLARTGALDGPDGLICLLERSCAAEGERALRDLARGRRPRPLPRVETRPQPA